MALQVDGKFFLVTFTSEDEPSANASGRNVEEPAGVFSDVVVENGVHPSLS